MLLTQGPGVVWVPDALCSELLEEGPCRQLPHQVHGQGVILLGRGRQLASALTPPSTLCPRRTRQQKDPQRKMLPKPSSPLPGFSVLPDSAVLTRPNSDDQLTTMVLGTVAESRARGVMLMGRLGLLGSAPFLVGGR